jgi:DNA-binding PadR family transcriptional regulator
MERIRRASTQTLTLLAELMVQPVRWRHGYALSQQTGLKSGTLYPILMRLSDRELLESRWQETPETGRPPRHMYRLTAAGRVYAATELADPDRAGLTASNAPA